MNDIKVSDLISLPVEQNKSRHFGHVVYSTTTDEVVFSASSAEIAKYIAHAINNHDRLTKEIEQLTAQNKALIEMLSEISDEAISYEKRTGKSVTWAYDARKLLAKAQNANTKTNS